ncbi:Putative regulatory protein, FmdB, Zinc ribbon domain containing protein [uncultured Caudovirales phage]|uniref:Regulatory protein, FmdB, Zinc ribbon domain containing protein n=1 Tax=uncultured Caudovirales phage TaxID=2100421 RepID=A0A6J7X0W6_9CAUD|nr:Putative regulatory protein, FmdB, Zinc ribbon domain containing protein [uncultured Caudovirales phage]
MPIYEFSCKNGHSHDILHKWPAPQVVVCQLCKSDAVRQVSMPQKTAGKWGDTSAKFISAFGKEMTSSQAAAEAKKRGLVHEADLPKHFIEDRLDKEWQDARQHDKTMEKFNELKKTHDGDASRAWSEVYSVDEMKKSGTLKEDAANG